MNYEHNIILVNGVHGHISFISVSMWVLNSTLSAGNKSFSENCMKKKIVYQVMETQNVCFTVLVLQNTEN